ncbi:MAG: amidohydrolase [Betaproteobacteria bacterium]|nr:amidohydrolase [Betaproteobacteria bacterium]
MNKPVDLPLDAVNRVREFHDELTTIRQDLHRHPELGFEENYTAEVVARELTRLGIEHHRGLGKTGIVGVIHGQRTDSGRSIGLRADMDALPMHEENAFAHKSTIPGKMHGCGHDGHTTMLLGAARYLNATKKFNGTVYLIFQPGEEGYAGAKAMMEDGLFERFPADEIYALHNWPGLPAGKIGLRPGPTMAAADRVTIHIEGRGGHGAHPHAAIDPVVVAAHIIVAAQSIVSRSINPIDTAVISLCHINAGHQDAMSVIPREARIVGTVRTFKPETQDFIEQRLAQLVSSIATAFGARATLHFERVYPATVNTERESEFARDVAVALVGEENVVWNLDPSMGSEDFSFMLQKKPGCYLRLGQGGMESGCFLHNTKYDFNDEVIPLGAGLLAALAERALPLG